MRNQKGQVILVLILVMTVALAIGLSVIQRSLSDISTASKVEQSSRAYSAAEAGIERAIQANINITNLNLGNNATVTAVVDDTVPDSNQALEYPSLSKEEVAHVWLANPETLAASYNLGTIDLYWGTPNTSDQPALEITVVYQDNSGEYKSRKYFYDSDSIRASANRFSTTSCLSEGQGPIYTSLSPTVRKKFLCATQIGINSSWLPGLSKLILLRARILYSNVSQPLAVLPSTGGSLPNQAKIFKATGQSGQTQRKIQVTRLEKVVPFFFDYAVFSVGDISKSN